MLGSIFQNNVIRKIITAFGALFSNTTLVRTNNDGSEQERFIVPITFGQKEKYMQILQGDPEGNRSVQINLPLISYSLKGLKYDADRKQQTTIQNFGLDSSHGLQTQYSPVPYNFDFEVYIYVRTIQDGAQIVEQILPYFTPDYTLRLNLIPSMGITKDIPIILNGTEYEVENEGDEENSKTRTVIWTLSFTVKGFLFGPVSSGSIIKEAITNIYVEKDDPHYSGYFSKNITFVMSKNSTNGNVSFGNYKTSEIIYQGNTLPYAKATAKVLNWSNTTGRLEISDVQGVFVTNTPVIGLETGADHTLINYEIGPIPVFTSIITPEPPTANVDDNWTYHIVTTEH